VSCDRRRTRAPVVSAIANFRLNSFKHPNIDTSTPRKSNASSRRRIQTRAPVANAHRARCPSRRLSPRERPRLSRRSPIAERRRAKESFLSFRIHPSRQRLVAPSARVSSPDARRSGRRNSIHSRDRTRSERDRDPIARATRDVARGRRRSRRMKKKSLKVVERARETYLARSRASTAPLSSRAMCRASSSSSSSSSSAIVRARRSFWDARPSYWESRKRSLSWFYACARARRERTTVVLRGAKALSFVVLRVRARSASVDASRAW